ncbi:CRAC channel activity mediator [Popillia japonica]|uniref:CRAC channel activity mediator n=1 Tax=Popillia japonica TaxID=7064 RepID=A0AAW1HS55_POPJA
MCDKFPALSKAIFKEGVFANLDICKLVEDQSKISSYMDQSTQVNFPILQLPIRHRKMNRYNTSAELNTPYRNNSWVHLKPLSARHKSLNLSTETFHRSRLTYQTESPVPRPSPPTSDISSIATGRERTPPYSTASTFNYCSSPPPRQYASKPNSRQLTFSGSTESFQRSCKCLIEEEDSMKRRRVSTTSPEGLSWRRLHMSRAKLKATATTSELLSGFAMVAMVELQINEPTHVPEWLFVLFAVCTTVLVAVHIFALMISTYILPNIDAISKLDVCELVSESPHERMRGFIELAWAFSTILGLFLFLVEVAILCWVKFWDYSFNAAIASTIIVIPVLVIFVLFAVHFYHSLVVYRCDTSLSDMQKLEDMKRQLDEISCPV